MTALDAIDTAPLARARDGSDDPNGSPDRRDATDVRPATREDEPEIIRILHLMHAEGGLQPLDLDCAKQMFDRAFDKQGAVIGVIGRRPIEAMTYLLITRNWYTSAHHIEECFVYVNPDFRRSTHAKTLIGFAKACSLKLDLPLFIGVLSNKRRAAKTRLYRSQLGESSGELFVFNSKPPVKPRIRVAATTVHYQGAQP
jgi:hypothetical protein